MNIFVHTKEKIYFGIMAVMNIPFWGLVLYTSLQVALMLLSYMSVSLVEALMLGMLIAGMYGGILYLFFVFIPRAIAIGQIQGSGIKIGPAQFADIFALVQQQSAQLNLTTAPAVYVIQEGGVLSFFARKFGGTEYLVISSQLLQEAYDQGQNAVAFLIAHELSRITRKRTLKFKSFLIWPARYSPFLGRAYARSCVLTYDIMAHAICPQGAEQGIALFSAGPQLYRDVKLDVVRSQKKGFALWLYEITRTSPSLKRRLHYLHELKMSQIQSSFTARPAQMNQQPLFMDTHKK